MNDPFNILLRAGRTLSRLEVPMDKDEVRRFAVRAVDFAATAEGTNNYFAAIRGWLQPGLTRRGASEQDVDLVARAVEHAVDQTITLTQARRVLSAMWVGSLITNTGADQ